MRKVERIKQETVDKFGGKCQHCGYNRCLRALHFHHTDPSEKKDWSRDRGAASYEEINLHPERFLLLCANCHIEQHEMMDKHTILYNNCLHCGKPVRTKPSRIDGDRDKYCSRKCARARQKEIAITAESIEARFLKHVEKTDTCWNWTGHLDKGTTPVLSMPRADGTYAPKSAARVSWELYRTNELMGGRLGRSCRNLRCVRPDHITNQRVGSV